VTTDRHPDCEWVLENLDAFVDHELGRPGHAAVTAHCAHCGSCTRALEMAIRVRKMLRTLPSFEAPARVVDAAEREIRAGAYNVVALPSRRMLRLARTAALAAAAVILLVAGAWLIGRQRAVHEQQASDAEVRRATAELALAFGYVGRYSDGVVREDVMEKRVMPRIQRAMTSHDSGTSRDGAKQRSNETGL
jgi:putative zinc finger protein